MPDERGGGGIFRSVSSLGEIEDKLRRCLNLSGFIGTEFVPQIVPSVNVADATAPGNNTYRGRRFMGAALVAAAPNGTLAIRAVADVVIEGWTLTQDANNNWEVRYYPPGTADCVANINQPNILWTERCMVVTDVAPVLSRATPAAPAAGTAIARYRNGIAGVNRNEYPIHLPADSQLCWFDSLAANVGITFWGYAY